MIPKSCIVCGHDITGRWPAQMCSALCRSIANARRNRRKEKRRSAAYKLRRIQKAERQRAEIAARREQAQLALEEQVRLFRARQKARLMIWADRRKLDDLWRRLRRRLSHLYSKRREQELQRLRQATPEYRFKKRARDKARAVREMSIIYALREMGWLDGYDIVQPGERLRPVKIQLAPLRHCRIPPTRSKYKRFLLGYADRYRTCDHRGKAALVDQFWSAFRFCAQYKSRRTIARDLCNPKWPVFSGLIVVDSRGMAMVAPRHQVRRRGQRALKREREYRLKRRTIVRAFDGLGLEYAANGRRAPNTLSEGLTYTNIGRI